MNDYVTLEVDPSLISSGSFTPVPEFPLDKAYAAKIFADLGKPENDPDAIEFLNAVARGIAYFRTLKTRESKRSSITKKKKKLEKIRNLSEKLLAEMSDIEPTIFRDLDLAIQAIAFPHPQSTEESRILSPDNQPCVSLFASPPITHGLKEDLDNKLKLIIDSIDFIEKNFYAGSKGGRPKENARFWLAVEIANAFIEKLNTIPTATKDPVVGLETPYMSVLSIALRAAGVNIRDPFELARSAVRYVKTRKPI